MTPRVIGLCGYARAGKDSVAQLLAPHGYERRAHADAMREALYRLDPIVHVNELGDVNLAWYINALSLSSTGPEAWDVAKSRVPELRRLMQRMGTEVGRDFLGADIWVEALWSTMDFAGEYGYAITDVRFPNEAQRIVDNGGQVWRVVRRGCGPANDHPSETSMDDWRCHRIIPNYGNLEDLREAVEVALEAAE